MKINYILKKIICYLPIIMIATIGVVIGRLIYSFEIVVRGITGFAALFFMYRFFR